MESITTPKQVMIAHFVMIPFTGVGIYDFKNQTWFDYRIKIFKEFTLPSLINQTSKGFIIWLTFRPEEYDNPSVKELEKYLQGKGVYCMMTFDGLLYHDDKFSVGFKDRAYNIARVVRQAWREKNFTILIRIPAIFKNTKNKTLLERLKKSLEAVTLLGDPKRFHFIYLTRLDSDDMFHKDAMKNIQAITPFPGAIVCKKGYVYNLKTKEMAEWNPPTNPPFHTIIFPREVFFDPAYHKQYYRNFKSHEDIPKIFVTKTLPDGSYCVLINENHISTLWNHPFRGKTVDNSLIHDFGVQA